jgi:hypothetical protein
MHLENHVMQHIKYQKKEFFEVQVLKIIVNMAKPLLNQQKHLFKADILSFSFLMVQFNILD